MKINKNIRASISYRTRELQKLLHSSELDFFAKSACSHSFPWGHMTPNDRAVSRQNSPGGQHRAAESMTSEGDGVQLPANVDRYANSICLGN